MRDSFNGDTFLSAFYKDTRLKNRAIFWTFISLVLPAALFLSLGVSEPIVFIALIALLLPLQVVIFNVSQRKRTQSSDVSLREVKWTLHHPFVTSATEQPVPEDVSWAEMLARLKSQNLSVVVISHPTTDHAQLATEALVLLEASMKVKSVELLHIAEQQRRMSLASAEKQISKTNLIASPVLGV